MKNIIQKYAILKNKSFNRFNRVIKQLNDKHKFSFEKKFLSSSHKIYEREISNISIKSINLEKYKLNLRELHLNTFNSKNSVFNKRYLTENLSDNYSKLKINKEISKKNEFNNNYSFFSLNNSNNSRNIKKNKKLDIIFKNDDYFNHSMKSMSSNKKCKIIHKMKKIKIDKEYFKNANNSLNIIDKKKLNINNERNMNLLLNNKINYKNISNIIINKNQQNNNIIFNRNIINRNNINLFKSDKFTKFNNLKEKFVKTNNSKIESKWKIKKFNNNYLSNNSDALQKSNKEAKKEKLINYIKSKNCLSSKKDKNKHVFNSLPQNLKFQKSKNTKFLKSRKKRFSFFNSGNNNQIKNSKEENKNSKNKEINYKQANKKKIIVIKKKKRIKNLKLNNIKNEKNNFYSLTERNNDDDNNNERYKEENTDFNYNESINYDILKNSDIVETNFEIFEIIADTKIKSMMEYEKEKSNILLLKEKYNKKINDENIDKNDYSIRIKNDWSRDTFSFRPTNNDSKEISEQNSKNNEEDLINKDILNELEEKLKKSLEKNRIKIIRKKKVNPKNH